MPENSAIIYCKCAYYQLHDPPAGESVMSFLKDARVKVHVFADLCETAALEPGKLKFLSPVDKIYVFACAERAVKGLLKYAGIDTAGKQIYCVNMRSLPEAGLENVKAAINNLPVCEGFSLPAEMSKAHKQGQWVPWYPVIDSDNCIGCKQCVNFCLFGVYGVDTSGNAEVVRPDACKTDCPACARVCPAGAIMFPKHGEGSINGREHPNKAQSEKDAGDNLNLLDQLKQRNAETDRTAAAAGKSLKELQEKYSIPDKVIKSLSPEQMRQLKGRQNQSGQ